LGLTAVSAQFGRIVSAVKIAVKKFLIMRKQMNILLIGECNNTIKSEFDKKMTEKKHCRKNTLNSILQHNEAKPTKATLDLSPLTTLGQETKRRLIVHFQNSSPRGLLISDQSINQSMRIFIAPTNKAT